MHPCCQAVEGAAAALSLEGMEELQELQEGRAPAPADAAGFQLNLAEGVWLGGCAGGSAVWRWACNLCGVRQPATQDAPSVAAIWLGCWADALQGSSE